MPCALPRRDEERSLAGLLFSDAYFVEQSLRVGKFGIAVDVEIAGRFFEHASCRHVVALPVVGFQIFYAYAGACRRAVDETSVAEIDGGMSAVGRVRDAEYEDVAGKKVGLATS